MRALATITRNIEQAEHLIGQRATIAMYHAPHVYTGPCLAVRSLYDTVGFKKLLTDLRPELELTDASFVIFI
jgi:hypothetical protein